MEAPAVSHTYQQQTHANPTKQATPRPCYCCDILLFQRHYSHVGSAMLCYAVHSINFKTSGVLLLEFGHQQVEWLCHFKLWHDFWLINFEEHTVLFLFIRLAE